MSVYLFESQNSRVGETELSSIHWLTLRWLQWPGLGQMKSEPGASSRTLMWVEAALSLTFSWPSTDTWSRSGARGTQNSAPMRSWHRRQELCPVCHNISPHILSLKKKTFILPKDTLKNNLIC